VNHINLDYGNASTTLIRHDTNDNLNTYLHLINFKSYITSFIGKTAFMGCLFLFLFEFFNSSN